MKELTDEVLVFSATPQGIISINNPKYWDRQAGANSIDPDQMPRNVAADKRLPFWPVIQQVFRGIKRYICS